MKLLLLILGFSVSALVSYHYLNFQDINENKGTRVLAETSENTPTLTPEPTLTPIPAPSLSLTLTPTSIPILTPTPTLSLSLTLTLTPTSTLTPPPQQPVFTSEQINGFIDRFAGQYGISSHVLRAVAVCESGFNPKAVNGPYAGLFQFNATTWKNNRILMGEETDISLRFNAEEATQTAAYLLSIGKGYLWPNCLP